MPRFYSKRDPIGALAVCLLLSVLNGCASTVSWREPTHRSRFWSVHSAESGAGALREAFDCGLALEKACDERCVDRYYHVAVASTQACCSSNQLHNDALQRLVIAGQKFGRFDPRCGLTVVDKGQTTTIPVKRLGFVWKDDEFQRLVPVGDYSTNAVRCLHQTEGTGIPVVVCNNNPLRRPFLPAACEFPATLTLEFDQGATLVLYDPKRHCVDSRSRPLARDLSAAYAYRLQGERSGLIEQFITDPVSSDGKPRLSFIEPYQPGKIPVVLVHGLLSNPFTWTQTLTDLESNPWYVRNFQTLVFRYPSGQSFLASAAELRQQLACARRSWDPAGIDPALTNGILVGHSQGGLLSKLLVTESQDSLWAAVANKPIDSVRIPAQIDRDVRRAFFFSPSDEVSRVVFVGTPHQGALTANRLIGRLGSALVKMPEASKQAHQQLIACNPDTFSPEVRRRIPTSIDLLEPNSCLLQAISKLPVHPRVQLHSIIGDSSWRPLSGPSDGVVPVSSARGVDALSELFVDESHTTIHQHLDTRDELFRILAIHLEEYQ